MGDTFPNGGTNSVVQDYSDSNFTNGDLTVGSTGATITNQATGEFSFSPSSANNVDILGNLNNSGSIVFNPATSGTTPSVRMGDAENLSSPTAPADSLTQVGGSITYSNSSNATEANPSFLLNYASLDNDANSTIDIASSTSLNMKGSYTNGVGVNYPVNFSNAGVVTLSAATGGTLEWGQPVNIITPEVQGSSFSNTGSFNIHNMAAAFEYKSMVNSGNISIDATTVLPTIAAFASAEATYVPTNFFADSLDNKSGATFSISNQSGSPYTSIIDSFENESGASISLNGVSAIVAGNLDNNGTIQVENSTVSMALEPFAYPSGSFTGTGTYSLTNSTFNSGGTLISSNFILSGGNNVLDLSGSAGIVHTISPLSGTIRGFEAGDQIIVGQSAASVTYDPQAGVLSIGDSGTLKYDIGTGYTKPFYDTNGIITYAAPYVAPCFASGTLIRTESGETSVEHLTVGDRVVTASGQQRDVIWLGHRRVDCAAHVDPREVWPYRIRAHAFGENRPSRDLWLSPDHAVAVSCLDDVLIPIKHLDNGATIAQVQVDTVAYWHVELREHDLLLAENLPAESFLDTRGKDFFGRAVLARDRALFATRGTRPYLKHWQADSCLPLVTHGVIVDAIRLQLLDQARRLGWTLTDEAELRFEVEGGGEEVRLLSLSAGRYRLIFPAGVRSVVLASRSFVPRHTDLATYDDRRLGVPLRRLAIHDMAGQRGIDLDHPGLGEGFHAMQAWEGDAWRWTDGRGVIPASLWAGSGGAVILDVELASGRGQMRAWVEPARAEVGRECDMAMSLS